MEISWLQAIFACLSSMPGMGGSSIGNYTLGRPLVGGLVCGLILGDVTTGVLVGCAMQVVYIALVTPGGTVSADVRAVSYIGIPLAGCGKLRGNSSCDFLRNNGRNAGNRIVLRNCNDQPCMAAHWMAGR